MSMDNDPSLTMPADVSNRGEMFSEDEDGNKTDAHIHEPILEEGEDARTRLLWAWENARELGFPDELIEKMFGPPLRDDDDGTSPDPTPEEGELPGRGPEV